MFTQTLAISPLTARRSLVIGPHVLRDRLPEPYYTHIYAIMKTCINGIRSQLSISVDIYEWRIAYYSQYNPVRLCTMTPYVATYQTTFSIADRQLHSASS